MIRADPARAAIAGLAAAARFVIVQVRRGGLVKARERDAVLLNLAVAVANLDEAAGRIPKSRRPRKAAPAPDGEPGPGAVE